MIELVKSNNLVTLSFVEALLRDADIPFQLLDDHMSLLDGWIGILPRRIVVPEAYELAARQLLIDADLAHELEKPKNKKSGL